MRGVVKVKLEPKGGEDDGVIDKRQYNSANEHSQEENKQNDRRASSDDDYDSFEDSQLSAGIHPNSSKLFSTQI